VVGPEPVEDPLNGEGPLGRVVPFGAQHRVDRVLEGIHQAAAADPATRAAVEGYLALVAEERALVDQVLAVADELAAGTIDTVLATSDLELGLEALFGHRPPRP